MTDTFDPLGTFKSFFFAGNGPDVNLKLREKIALAMMMQKRKFPTTLGEGLGAIGESIGDIGLARRLEAQDKISQGAASGLGAENSPDDVVSSSAPKPIVRSSFAPTEDISEEQTLRPPIAGAQPNLRPQPRSIAPGDLPPTGEAGNTGNMQFTPPLGSPGNPIQPPQPPAALPAAPPPAPPPALPQGPPPPPPGPPPAALPPERPAQGFEDRFSPAGTGRRSALPNAPVMAFGGDPSENVPPPANPRDMVAQALMPKPSAPPPAPTADAFTQVAQATPQIRRAPPPAQAAPPQPQAIPGYVTPIPEPTPGAPLIAPNRREMELRAVMAANQGNPYAAQSPAAIKLKVLEEARAQRQEEANKRFAAGLKTEQELTVLRETQRGDQLKRDLEARGIRQGLIDGGVTAPAPTGPAASAALGTPNSPQRSGRPNLAMMPGGAIPKEWAEIETKKMSATATNLEAVKPELTEAVGLINQIRTHPGKEWGVGAGAPLAGFTPQGKGFNKLVEQLMGKNLVAAYQKIKGTGPVGEKEGENIAKAQAAVSTATDKKSFDTAVDNLENSLRWAVERAERSMNKPVTAWQTGPNDPYAPDVGEVRKGFEYLGGDPNNKQNWKRVQ